MYELPPDEDSPGRGPDEGSVEDVLAKLALFDEQLREAGMLEPTGAELSEQSLKRFARDLRDSWTRLGLSDPEKLTTSKLRDLDPELILQLDIYTAEILFFDTAKKIWRKLGSEPVNTDMILGQLQPPNDPGRPAKGVDLDRLRSEQRDEAFAYLSWIGIDREQLANMLLGSPQRQHNVIRLAYVLSEEPALKELRKQYAKEAKTIDQPRQFEGVAKRVLNELKDYIFMYKEIRRKFCRPEAAMGYLDHVQFERAMKLAENSAGLIDLVLEDMKSK